MPILPFSRKNVNYNNEQPSDWSQQEVADFYRAQRLLVENGASIGIDRGLSDVGEPWMVFFDTSSQDVFLHIARIRNRCHLICEPFNLRLSSSSISDLVTKFETSVRDYMSMRTENTKNVIVHPAARIIMSISAIFLLFKLENSEAYAKSNAEKNALGADGINKLNDKASSALARAQAAFARAFDSADAPVNAAILAGIIIASELALSVDRVDHSVPENAQLASTVNAQNIPLILSDSEEQQQQFADASYAQPDVKPQIIQSEINNAEIDSKIIIAKQKALPSDGSHAPEIVAQTKKETTLIQVAQVVEEQTDSQIDASDVLVEKTTLSATKREEVSDAIKALKDTLGIELLKGEFEVSELPQTDKDEIGEISVATLDMVDDQVGFFLQTHYDQSKLYSLIQYLTGQMTQLEYDYMGRRVLIEDKNAEELADTDIGLWTNVMADGSSISVVGAADLIDDVTSVFV